MERCSTAVGSRLAARIRALRADRGLTLDALSERAGVSRSMVSLIERAESSPTAAVLDRLAGGLGVTLAALFADGPRPDPSPVARRADQPVWRDPETSYLRRNLSPPGGPSSVELVEVELPPGARVAYDTGPRAVAVSQQIWIMEGQLALTVGTESYELGPGDCLAMRVDAPIVFRNVLDRPARYLVALVAEPPLAARGGGPR